MKPKQKFRIFLLSFFGITLFAVASVAEAACSDYFGDIKNASIQCSDPNSVSVSSKYVNGPSASQHCCVNSAQAANLVSNYNKSNPTFPQLSLQAGKIVEAAAGGVETPRETPNALEEGGYSGLIPCGRSGDPNSDPSAMPCTACHAVVAGKRLMDYLTAIMVVIAITVIVAMGVLYIISGVNEGLKKTAKSGLAAVFWGLVLMLSAWLIVSTVLRFTANDNFVKGGGGFIGLMPGDGVYGLQCNIRSSAGSATLTPGVSGGVTAGAGKYAGGAGSGQCAPIKNAGNPCSVENLKKNPCWAGLGDDVIAQASGICNAESQGIPGVKDIPRTDHCGCATCPVVSHGLFQVNITAHYDKMGCPKIAEPPLNNTVDHPKGSKKNWYDESCKIVAKQSDLQACINKAANDINWNITYACQLYKQSGWKPWNYSYTEKCNSFK